MGGTTFLPGATGVCLYHKAVQKKTGRGRALLQLAYVTARRHSGTNLPYGCMAETEGPGLRSQSQA